MNKIIYISLLIIHYLYPSSSFITTPNQIRIINNNKLGLRSFNNYNNKLLTQKNNNDFNNKNSSKIYKKKIDDNYANLEDYIIIDNNTIFVIAIYTFIFLFLSIPK